MQIDKEKITTVIDNSYPPNIDDIKKVLNIGKNVIFTFGNTIYNPSGGDIDLPLMAHEQTHSIQQENIGPEEWWKKYLSDNNFRLEQELQAYKIQYKYYCNVIKDRNARYKFLNRIASDLSSEVYGNLISKSDALSKIVI